MITFRPCAAPLKRDRSSVSGRGCSSAPGIGLLRQSQSPVGFDGTRGIAVSSNAMKTLRCRPPVSTRVVAKGPRATSTATAAANWQWLVTRVIQDLLAIHEPQRRRAEFLFGAI